MQGTFNSYKIDKINIEDTAGVNEEVLAREVLEIYDIADKLKQKFNLIETLASQVPECFKSLNATNFSKKFTNLSGNFLVIEGNVKTYAEDLNWVRINYIKRAETLASEFRYDEEKIKESIGKEDF